MLLKSSQSNATERSEYVLENILEYEEYIIEEAQRVTKHTQFCAWVRKV